MNLRTTVESAAVKTVMGLPERVQRLAAGRPLVLDGQTLATDLHLMLRLQQLARRAELGAAEIAKGRAAMRDNRARRRSPADRRDPRAHRGRAPGPSLPAARCPAGE